MQQFARLFHHYHQGLSPQSENGSEGPLSPWDSVAPDERDRLVQAARLAMLDMEASAGMEEDRRRYFAKPGEAEWGC